MSKIAVVSGGSSGIGKFVVEALVKKGLKVYEISRRDLKPEGFTHICADVSDEKSINKAIDRIIEKEDRIDILINCAGFGISGALEFTDNKSAKKLLDVNLFGSVNLCRAVIPYMRKAGCGRIVNISSAAYTFPIPFQGWYSVSKAAVTSFSMTLANEVAPFGISVCCVAPGDIKTGFTSARQKDITGNDIYGGKIESAVSKMEKDEQNGLSPKAAGYFTAKIALKAHVKPVYAFNWMYGFLMVLSRILPLKLVNFILGKMYS